MKQPVAPNKTTPVTNRKSYDKKWIIFIILPFALLFFTAIAQTIVRFMVSSSPADSNAMSLFESAVNIFSVLVGIVAIVFLLLIPLWIIMLVRGESGDSNKSKTVAVVLAVVFGLFAWLYTYNKDAWKFWVNFSFTLLTLGLWSTMAWVWAIADTASKPEEYYTNYAKPKAS